MQIWIVVIFLLSTTRDQIDYVIEHDDMDACSCDTIVTWQSLIVITYCAKFNVAIIVVMIIIDFKEIKEKIRVKKEDHIKVVVVEVDVIQKEEFVQVNDGGNFVIVIVIVAFQR